jgi:hypothetical protein
MASQTRILHPLLCQIKLELLLPLRPAVATREWEALMLLFLFGCMRGRIRGCDVTQMCHLVGKRADANCSPGADGAHLSFCSKVECYDSGLSSATDLCRVGVLKELQRRGLKPVRSAPPLLLLADRRPSSSSNLRLEAQAGILCMRFTPPRCQVVCPRRRVAGGQQQNLFVGGEDQGLDRVVSYLSRVFVVKIEACFVFPFYKGP